MAKTAAQKRWALLRNVRIATKRTSLKPDEKHFLKVLSSSKATKSSSKQDNNNKGDNKNNDDLSAVRKRVRGSVVRRRQSLTCSEMNFLNELIDCPGISVEILMTAEETLNKSPLFNPELINEEDDGNEDEDTKEKFPSSVVSEQRKSIRARRASVVSLDIHNSIEEELWRTKPRSSRFSQRLSSLDLSEEPEIRGSETSKASKRPFFSKLFNLNFDDSDEENDEEEAPQDVPDDARPSTVSIPFSILGATVEDKSSWPRVLSPPLMDSLRPHMPFAVQNDNYWLKYSLRRDGGSLKSLLALTRQSHRAVLAIETFDNEVFGAFTSSPWHHGGSRFYGSGEAFVWKLSQPRKRVKTVDEMVERESDVEVFKWSRKNRNVQMSTPRQLVVGGGGVEDEKGVCEVKDEWTFALTLDGDLMRGGTGCCVTFDSPHLAKSAERNDGVFEVNNVEVWTMTPVETVDSAEKLEYGREFIFEHGAFVEF